jgi:carboxypeptidase C (cathepsin A)
MINKKGLAASILLIGLASCQTPPVGFPFEDKVNELANQPRVGKAFDMYSGYLNITHTKKQLHYVAVMSENDV